MIPTITYRYCRLRYQGTTINQTYFVYTTDQDLYTTYILLDDHTLES